MANALYDSSAEECRLDAALGWPKVLSAAFSVPDAEQWPTAPTVYHENTAGPNDHCGAVIRLAGVGLGAGESASLTGLAFTTYRVNDWRAVRMAFRPQVVLNGAFTYEVPGDGVSAVVATLHAGVLVREVETPGNVSYAVREVYRLEQGTPGADEFGFDFPVNPEAGLATELTPGSGGAPIDVFVVAQVGVALVGMASADLDLGSLEVNNGYAIRFGWVDYGPILEPTG